MRIRPRNILMTLALAAAVFGMGRFLISPVKTIPADFLEARLAGAEVSQRIVEFLDASLNRLDEVSEKDRQGSYSAALVLVSDQLRNARQNDANAVDLAAQLEKMALAVNNIRPAGARSRAVEAISYEAALVSRLITYNDQLKVLFSVLQDKFASGGTGYKGQVQELVKVLNESAGEVNKLNERFNEAMAEFDQALAN